MNHVKVRSHTKDVCNSTLLYFYTYLVINPDNIYLGPKHVHNVNRMLLCTINIVAFELSSTI